MAKDGKVSRKQHKLIQALSLGQSVAAAAKANDIAERTAYRWLDLPHVQAERTRLEDELRQAEEAEITRIMSTGYAAVHERVKALDTWARIVEKSMIDPKTQEVNPKWLTPEKLREWRGMLDDLAKELGQRVTKKEIEHSGSIDVTAAKDALFHKIAAFAKKADAES